MEFDVVLLPSFAQVDWWRKREAESAPGGVFAQTITTFDAWVADLWELNGDGRVIVDAVQREMFMRRAFAEAPEGAELVGAAPVAVRCMRLAAGVEELERAVAAARTGEGAALAALSGRERDFLAAIARYEDAIENAGLVEPGEAAARLSERGKSVFPGGARVLVAEGGALTLIEERFFGRCGELDVEVRYAEGHEGVGRAPEEVDLRFAFPSGRLAQPGLIGDCVEAADDADHVVVACKDPLDMFARLVQRLGAPGFRLRLQASRPLAQTDFGRALLACRRVLSSDALDQAALSDAVRSFFSGIAPREAVRIDELLRSDRIAPKSGTLERLAGESETFAQLMGLAGDFDALGYASSFEQRAQASGRPRAWVAEQLAAIARVRAAFEAARSAGAGIEACDDVLEGMSIPIAAQVGDSGVEVLVTSQALAAALEPGSFDVVVVADLTSADYPVADKEDAASTLFEALGLQLGESALDRARREFRALLRLPVRQAVLMRPLADDDADETYPSVLLEELVDVYRDDPSDVGEVDNDYRLPEELQAGLVTRGEELLFANVRTAAPDGGQAVAAEIPEPRIDDLAPGDERLVGARPSDAGVVEIGGKCPSPSQIELYLECPYQWFASRRMNIGEFEEGFGPAEKGSFAHAVLQEFYQRFQRAGHLKVGEGNLDEARELMRAVAVELAAAQYEKKPGGRESRLVAVGELERREVEALCDQLVNYLDFEARLLPTFHPAYFEHRIDYDDGVEFAGRAFKGIVDRIDVDDAGRAVVIDYKGSVGDRHEIAGKVEGDAGKVQTRIYAQAVKRALGLDVVAALYVSYGRRRAAAGAFDPTVVEAAHLPGMKVDKCACGSLGAPPDPLPDKFSLADLTFSAMLDETEALAARAVDAMAAGVIEPAPAHDEACRYCPVLPCPKRGE